MQKLVESNVQADGVRRCLYMCEAKSESIVCLRLEVCQLYEDEMSRENPITQDELSSICADLAELFNAKQR